MEFEANYHYAPTEQYNTGRGLSVAGIDAARANFLFDLYVKQGESYALQITDGGKIIREHGDMAAATRSMLAAHRARKAAA